MTSDAVGTVSMDLPEHTDFIRYYVPSARPFPRISERLTPVRMVAIFNRFAKIATMKDRISRIFSAPHPKPQNASRAAASLKPPETRPALAIGKPKSMNSQSHHPALLINGALDISRLEYWLLSCSNTSGGRRCRDGIHSRARLIHRCLALEMNRHRQRCSKDLVSLPNDSRGNAGRE